MRIALVSPKSHFMQHRVRGTGFYITNLEKSLRSCDKQSIYISCSQDQIPSDVDIVHYLFFEPFFMTLPFFKKTKTIITIHDLIPLVFPQNFPKGIKGSLRWEIQRRLLKGVDTIVTDSDSSKKDIQRFTGVEPDKIKVIYLAASKNFKKIKNPKLNYNLPDKFVLYVGDATWNKNLPKLVEAIKKINLPLVMVGKALVDNNFDKKNPWNSDLLKIQNLTKDNKEIIKLGFVSDEDLTMLYNRATIFAMPSLYEGFGLPLLEAMGSGCPVVTSRKGSIPEIGGNAVYYVDPYNLNDIANGIKKVFSNKKLREELSQKGLDQAKKFSWEKTAKQTANVYRNLFS